MRNAIPRRGLLVGLGAVALAGGGYFVRDRYFPARSSEVSLIGAREAHARAVAGTILLIDIRRPDEWAATGIPEGGVPLDMRSADFIAALRALADDAPGRPVALICARGVRSARLAFQLRAAGFTDIIDIPEGMLGSRSGPGWVKAGLPVVRG